MDIRISKIFHRGNARLKLDFAYDKNVIALVKQIPGCKWSQTLRAWHVPDTQVSADQLKQLIGIENETSFTLAEQLPEHATEYQIILPKTGPILPAEVPVKGKDVYIEVINRKIFVKMPKNDEDVRFILSLRYSRWLKGEYRWVIPEYAGNMELITDYFGDRIAVLNINDTIHAESGNTTPRVMKRNDVLMIKTRSGRVKIIASFNKRLITAIKGIPYHKWDMKNKWWTIPFSENFVQQLSDVITDERLTLMLEEEPAGEGGVKRISVQDITNYRRAPVSYTNKLTELMYSRHTIKNYVSVFEEFMNYFFRYDIDLITEPQIQEFLRFLVSERRVSPSYQNVAINAIKFYYEKVCKGQRKFYYIDRPQRDKTLPVVLSVEEITAMIKAEQNIKHKLILILVYSAGLRLSEIINLKFSDIDRDRMQIRIEKAKGRKDRYTILSVKVLHLLDVYKAEHDTGELIFTGMGGRPYSERSVQHVVKNAAKAAGITKVITPKTLRHTFATHCLENGVDLRYIQSMLGHSSSKTTEIYTHVTTKGFEKIKSPMDELDI